MRFWKRRKKAKEQPEAKQNIEDVLEHLNTRGAYTDSAEYKRQAEHEMLGHCEEIIEAIRELEEAKSEYRIVTDYLNDIQKSAISQRKHRRICMRLQEMLPSSIRQGISI